MTRHPGPEKDAKHCDHRFFTLRLDEDRGRRKEEHSSQERDTARLTVPLSEQDFFSGIWKTLVLANSHMEDWSLFWVSV